MMTTSTGTVTLTLEDAALVLDALHAALNCEGAALHGARLPAFHGLDAPYHFFLVREAVKVFARSPINMV